MHTQPPPRSHQRRLQPAATRAYEAARARPARQRHVLAGAAAVVSAGLIGLIAIAPAHAAAHEWEVTRVDDGTKPALAVTPDGEVGMVYMLERLDGWVRIATLQDERWTVEQVADGYFYGPPDIAAAEDGTFHAAYHDHQDSSFQPDKGDAVVASGRAGDWTVVTAEDPGHDGWDNRVTVDASGRPHMVGVDPEEFGGTDGVEYYRLADDGTWTAEPVGSDPQTYRWALGVAVDPAGAPWVTFYDGPTSSLRIAGPDTDDGWTVATVDDSGDTGLYSELAIDADGGQHISYFERDGETTGSVKYAFREGPEAEWQIAAIDRLDAVDISITGARNITSVALGPDGRPAVAYGDESTVRVAQPGEGEWLVETVVEAGEVPLGQIVSLDIDGDGRLHLAFAEVTDRSELDGSVWYATAG